MLKGIVIWGVTAITASVLAGLLAAIKNRDYSAWIGWCFLLPPLVLLLLVLPRNPGPRPRQRTLDDEDAADPT
jgi:hypothetical protein